MATVQRLVVVALIAVSVSAGWYARSWTHTCKMAPPPQAASVVPATISDEPPPLKREPPPAPTPDAEPIVIVQTETRYLEPEVPEVFGSEPSCPVAPNWTLRPGDLRSERSFGLWKLRGEHVVGTMTESLFAQTPAGEVVRNVPPEEIAVPSLWAHQAVQKPRYWLGASAGVNGGRRRLAFSGSPWRSVAPYLDVTVDSSWGNPNVGVGLDFRREFR